MKLVVNDQPQDYDGEPTIPALLAHLGHEVTAVAVAVNEEFVSRRAYAETRLHEGDRVEIVAPMQGG